MTFHRKVVGFLCLVLVLAFAACREREDGTSVGNPPGAQPEDVKLARQAVERTQTTLREVTDVLVKQAAAQNAAGRNDPGVTEAIRQYESLSAEDRIRYVATNDRFRDLFAAWGDPTENVPATPQLKRQSWFPFFDAPATQPQNFDAVKKSDVLAQQVRLTNALFQDADPRVMTAVDAWEKMTPEQKQAFTATPENSAYYWNYLYMTYRLQLLRYYWAQTRTGYWGYRAPADIRVFDPKEFDLKQGVGQ